MKSELFKTDYKVKLDPAPPIEPPYWAQRLSITLKGQLGDMEEEAAGQSVFYKKSSFT